MKYAHLISIIVVAAAVRVQAADSDTPTNNLNSLTISPRVGFNMSTRFKGLTVLPSPGSSRLTPHGDRYNYDDGYVLTDISGNAGGQTWYWGYDNSSSQAAGDTVLLNRSTTTKGSPSQTLDTDPSVGTEVVFRRQIGEAGSVRFGLEVAGNWQNLSASGNFTATRDVMRTTDAYPFTSQTRPPAATPSAPYQGSFEGPGFVIGGIPSTLSSTLIPGGATIVGHREFDTDLWGLRVGPYMEIPIIERINLSFSAGLVVGLVDAGATWTETVTYPSGKAVAGGNGHDGTAMLGAFAAANVSWQLNPRWSIIGGAQYQSLSNYEHAFAGQKVELKLSNALFVNLGISFAF